MKRFFPAISTGKAAQNMLAHFSSIFGGWFSTFSSLDSLANSNLHRFPSAGKTLRLHNYFTFLTGLHDSGIHIISMVMLLTYFALNGRTFFKTLKMFLSKRIFSRSTLKAFPYFSKSEVLQVLQQLCKLENFPPPPTHTHTHTHALPLFEARGSGRDRQRRPRMFSRA